MKVSVIVPAYNAAGTICTVAEGLLGQTYRNMEKIQDRITTFISGHSHMTQKRLEELMLDTSQLVKDVGTMLEGPEAVREGLIDEVGGIREALGKLYELIEMQEKE